MGNETKSGQIFALMSKVMSEVNEIGKNSRNQQQGYSFRGIDDVMATFHGPLSRNGIFFAPEVMGSEVTERQSQKGGTLIYTTVDMAFTFFAPDGSSVTARTRGEAMDSGDKSTNKAMSAALKYALLQTFCVPVEASDDADNETHEVAPRAINAVSRSTGLDRAALTAEIVSLMQKGGRTEDEIASARAWLAKATDQKFSEKLAEVRAKYSTPAADAA